MNIDEACLTVVEQSLVKSELMKLYFVEILRGLLPYGHGLRVPSFRVSQVKDMDNDITYRKINDWEARGLIGPGRIGSKRGWRTFSTPEVVELLLISDLKRFGMTSDRISKILDALRLKAVGESTPGTLTEAFVFMSCMQFHIGMLVSSDGSVRFGLSEQMLPEHLGGLDYPDLFLYVPFSTYFGRLQLHRGNVLKFLDREMTQFIHPKLAELIRIISDEKYEKITVHKVNGDVTRVEALGRERSKKTDNEILALVHGSDFQRIELQVKEGEVITVLREEITKL